MSRKQTNFSETFRNPPAAYRGKPFWAWNGQLDPDELRRQVRIMHRMGLGGFFMHSRVGLATPYLSEEWFDCIGACIDEAESLGMEAWLYDEDRWPSGPAGGLVTQDPRFRMRSLACEVSTRPAKLEWSKDVLAVFTARLDEHTATDCKRIARGKTPRLATGQKMLVFREVLAPQSDWYNGYTYLDVLNPQAVAKFIEVTHEAYRQRFGEAFGRTVPGIFTDEPNHGGKFISLQHSNQPDTLPWTGALPKVFRKRYGYDLIAHLPELYYDVDGQAVTPARHDYHDCVTHLFVDSFARQIGQWCEANNLAHTGHVLCEQPMAMQTMVVGSAMRFYEHMQAPGMDLLTDVRREYDTARMVSSAARQFGRTWRLTETYGCTGWDFPLAGHKAIGDWQAAMGINLRCQHLSLYTLLGEAKRDYPASILFQSPWWRCYQAVEDYFARVNAAMIRGREVRDLLVILPIESVWITCRRGWNPRQPQPGSLDDKLAALRDTLLRANLDFDYGDEDILARHGSVTRGDSSVLHVGQAEYRAVIVPPSITLRSSTLKLLKRFADRGGRVIFAGDIAGYVDAEPSTAPAELAEATGKVPCKGKRVVAAVEDVARRVTITDGEGKEITSTLYLLREDEKAMYLFVCNLGETIGKIGGDPDRDRFVRDRTADLPEVRITGFGQCSGQPIELDPETGQRYLAEARNTAAGWTISTSLPPLGSRVFEIPRRKQRTKLPRRAKRTTVRKATIDPKRWDITLDEPNVFVLDRPEGRVGKGSWQKPSDVLEMDRRVRDALGLTWRGGEMKQPWTQLDAPAGPGETVELAYRFEVDQRPGGELFLALEAPDLYAATLNDQPVDIDAECGWWVDPSLRRVPLSPAMLIEGMNHLRLTCHYDAKHPGLEIVYLLGDFGSVVRGSEVRMTAPVRELRLGDWTRQGLSFYSGSVTYRTKLSRKLSARQRAVIRLDGLAGAAATVRVNGQDAGVVLWPPYELDVTDSLRGKGDELEITVLGNRRNSHGPLHQARRGGYISPASFTQFETNWQDEYDLVRSGLLKPPAFVIKQ